MDDAGELARVSDDVDQELAAAVDAIDLGEGVDGLVDHRVLLGLISIWASASAERAQPRALARRRLGGKRHAGGVGDARAGGTEVGGAAVSDRKSKTEMVLPLMNGGTRRARPPRAVGDAPDGSVARGRGWIPALEQPAPEVLPVSHGP
jgi:hypothetical protein